MSKREGRITQGCDGLYSDENEAALKTGRRLGGGAWMRR